MSIDTAALDEFRQSLESLANQAPRNELPDAERLKRARNVFMARVSRRTAVDLDTCIHCGMCAEACHFYIATGDERYTPMELRTLLEESDGE